ncbi:hypothetical protein, partial [Vibrio parahaemolyticus]|uniref:hypothetical protein n=1 Tax=Vibrio parahaemolyticus TaxID=670 RepID=UPI001F32C418
SQNVAYTTGVKKEFPEPVIHHHGSFGKQRMFSNGKVIWVTTFCRFTRSKSLVYILCWIYALSENDVKLFDTSTSLLPKN